MKTVLLFLCVSLPAFALSPGDPLPKVIAKNQDGKTVQLSDYKGKFLLLYFYPKDDTPGCTKEACSFRDNYAKVKEANTVVLGISRQDAKSHQAFISKHKLPFDLLVDSDGSLAKAFGVKLMPVVGYASRQSILVGPDQKVLHFYDKVDPSQHVSEILEDIKKASHQ